MLGRIGDTPACCAAVMMVDGYRYVALVATDPAHQRRGYAEAAMRTALDVAAREHGDAHDGAARYRGRPPHLSANGLRAHREPHDLHGEEVPRRPLRRFNP